MSVLSIDPGDILSAYTLFEVGTFRIISSGKIPNEELLKMVRDYRMTNGISLLAVETVQSFGMAVGATIFETCIVIGQFKEAFRSPVRLVKRTEVKMHICGTHKAKDSNIRQALIDRFGPVGNKKAKGHCYELAADTWSAFAIGLTALETPLLLK